MAAVAGTVGEVAFVRRDGRRFRMKPELTVMRDRYVRGWPSHDEGERVYACSLSAALVRDYSSDAHFAAYTAPVPRRLTTGAVGCTEITMHAIVFDVDDPTTHGSSEPASDEWRDEQRARCRRLEREHPGAFFYDTRGGYRCISGCESRASSAVRRTLQRGSRNMS
jgi:hypothetical protein